MHLVKKLCSFFLLDIQNIHGEQAGKRDRGGSAVGARHTVREHDTTQPVLNKDIKRAQGDKQTHADSCLSLHTNRNHCTRPRRLCGTEHTASVAAPCVCNMSGQQKGFFLCLFRVVACFSRFDAGADAWCAAGSSNLLLELARRRPQNTRYVCMRACV